MPVKDECERELIRPLPLGHPEEDIAKAIEELQNEIARALLVPLHLLCGV